MARQFQTREGHVVVTAIAERISLEAQIDEPGSISDTLWATSRYGCADFVQALLQIGIEIESDKFILGNEDLGRALHAATHHGHDTVVDRLLTGGANPDTEVPIFGTVLIAACYNGHGAAAERIIERGANINAQGGQYNNALWAATHRGHRNLVDLLLSKGANDDAKIKLGGDVITAPSGAGHFDI